MNKFRQEIEISKIKRCGTLHNKFRTVDELLAANSRGLGTAVQQIPSGPVFLCYTELEKYYLFYSIHIIFSLPCGCSVSSHQVFSLLV